MSGTSQQLLAKGGHRVDCFLYGVPRLSSRLPGGFLEER